MTNSSSGTLVPPDLKSDVEARHQPALSRLLSGFAGRLERVAGRGVIPRQIWATRTTHPARPSTEVIAAPYTDVSHSFSIAAAATSSTITGQRAIIKSLSDQSSLSFSLLYILGAGFGHQEITVAQLAEASDEEMSIVIESLVRSGRTVEGSENLTQAVASASGSFLEALLGNDESEGLRDPFDDLRSNIECLGLSTQPNSLATCLELTVELKRTRLHVIGPDLPTAIQALLDPRMNLSKDELAFCSKVIVDWKLPRLLFTLMLCRIFMPAGLERAALAKQFKNHYPGPLSKRTSEMLAQLLADAESERSVAASRPSEFFSRLVAAYHKIKTAQERGRAEALVEGIVEAFVIDASVIGFLDWPRILQIVREARFATPASLFVTMLMSDELVRSRFPLVYLGTGKGAFIGGLTTMIGSSRRAEGVSWLLSQIRVLPEPAAAALTKAVVSRPIFERLASALAPTRAKAKNLPKSEGTKLSLLRIDALRTAEDRKLLSAEFVREQIEAETERLRMNYFQGRMRTGRVRIPWEEISKSSRNFTEGTMPLRQIRASIEADPSVVSAIPRLATFIAERLSEHILYSSPSSIDQALSNNLRHGIVVPRFLRAFDDAFQAVRPGSFPLWDDATLELAFGADAQLIFAYREAVSQIIKAFVDGTLAVRRGGSLDTGLRVELRRRLEAFLRGSGRATQLEDSVGRVTVRLVKAELKLACRQLAGATRRQVESDLKSLRSAARTHTLPTTGSFLDSLETNLHDAFEEVRQWIGVAENSGEPIPFKLSDVVNLELLSTHLSDWNQLKVAVTSKLVAKNSVAIVDAPIKGRYLDLFQDLVHNLLNNAFTHSGEGLKTAVTIDLAFTAGTLEIRCTNSFSPKRRADLEARYSRTVALAAKKVGPQAREDKLSGFQKMRLALQHVSDSPVRINIPPLASRRNTFIVEIIVRGAPEIFDVAS